MHRQFFTSFSEKSVRVTLFVFSGLLCLSVAMLVLADETLDGENIFQDSDQDGLSNDEEKLYGTDPLNRDSDNDGYSDGIEVESGYNPLLSAPGDKVVMGGVESIPQEMQKGATSENLTEKVSQEILTVLKDAGDEGASVSMEQVNEAVQNALEGNTEDIQLPDVNIQDIKIKKAPSSKLSDKKYKEEERQDILEYLTAMAYVMANNAPQTFHTGDDLNMLLTSLSEEAVIAFTSGNIQYIQDLAEKGESMLNEIKGIEVPEAMLETHVQALKMAKYAAELHNELGENTTDPIGQIAVLSKAQGFLLASTTFAQDVEQKLANYNIGIVPLDL